MNGKVRLDAVLVQAVIAGALSFAHLHDLAAAAGQSGWKAWAYPVSVDLLLVAAWRRLRAGRDRATWTWFAIALCASLGANVATAGLLDMRHVPAWLCILVAGWPALAFLGGTLLVHAPAPTAPAANNPPEVPAEVPDVALDRADQPAPEPAPMRETTPELPAAPPAPATPAPAVPAALLDHARKIADSHRAAHGEPITAAALAGRLGLPAPMTDAITNQLNLT
ncbi:DUF2637 domain-containing protein [Streptomyces sp. NPDC008150]|uniref:DUF2637 domain-containing protein n=1 Tax=Streptomyces sp. NPDC008150 TaxID=3364816 RepID=UPI0036E3C77F